MHDLRDPSLSVRRSLTRRSLTGALMLLPALGCVKGEGLLGDYTDTDTGTATDTGADATAGVDSSGTTGPGCVEDCDPDFAVSYLMGPNFALRDVALLGDATCEGANCPAAVSPVGVDGTPIMGCPALEEASESPLGVEEYCRLAPVWLAVVLDVGFATAVERSSFEELRPRPDAPTLEEPYLWHAEVVELHGPGSAFRGNYEDGQLEEPARVTEVFNETCAARLTAEGIAWTPQQLETLCVGTWDDGGVLRPLRLDPAMVLTPTEGKLSTQGSSCDRPSSGPDTCCSSCDWLLGPAVARYGVDGGARRSLTEGTAIACDPDGDPLVDCRDLVLAVERDAESSYTYAWDGAAQAWPLPRYDKLRETHPDDRPAGLEAVGAACTNASGCAEGQQCIGTNPAGDACSTGTDCTDRTCQAEWFGGCQITAGGVASCVDLRFDANGVGACLAANADFEAGGVGDRLVLCDANADGQLSESECCDPALGGSAGCDPFEQPELVELPRYDRNLSLVGTEGTCACEEGQPAVCSEVVDAWCEAPVGSASDPGPASPAGHYALPLVTRTGGVRWDEEQQTMGLRLATAGSEPRAYTEACAEARGRIEGRSAADTWMANVSFLPELIANHDLALCSGSSYRLVFAESDAAQHVRSAGQGTLDGRSEHVFETPQLRVVPGSLFPTDNLDIKSCDSFSIQLSNRYDASESNLRKLELREGAVDGPRVAGGLDCDPLADAMEIAAGAIPCLTTDVVEDYLGTLGFSIDEEIHGPVLQPGSTYFVVLPGLADIEQMSDAEAYASAFHDVCGMPLVVGDTPEVLALWEHGFTIDGSCS